jgi:hypothetical protein
MCIGEADAPLYPPFFIRKVSDSGFISIVLVRNGFNPLRVRFFCPPTVLYKIVSKASLLAATDLPPLRGDFLPSGEYLSFEGDLVFIFGDSASMRSLGYARRSSRYLW